MARASRNISVLDGGESLSAAVDILAPVQARPLELSRPMAMTITQTSRIRFAPQQGEAILKSYGTAPRLSSEGVHSPGN
jgi:hypothetical protein